MTPPPVRLLALVGLRASGKSTLGAALAERLGWHFVDADLALAERVGQPAGRYLATVGEPAFRAAEATLLRPLLATATRTVLATGGGAVQDPEVRRLLQASDVFTVWLDAPPGLLASRAAAAGQERPPLTELPPDREFALLSERRRPWYAEVADAVVDASLPVARGVAILLDLARTRGLVAP